MIKISKECFSIEEVLDDMRSPEIGAIVVFLGRVRNKSKGRSVESIEIQVYENMALKQLKVIKEEALEKFPVKDIVIIHRYGNLVVSKNIMMIAVSSEHRAEAFNACRYMLETIKEKVPIWKKEITPNGDFWVEGEII